MLRKLYIDTVMDEAEARIKVLVTTTSDPRQSRIEALTDLYRKSKGYLATLDEDVDLSGEFNNPITVKAVKEAVEDEALSQLNMQWEDQ